MSSKNIIGIKTKKISWDLKHYLVAVRLIYSAQKCCRKIHGGFAKAYWAGLKSKAEIDFIPSRLIK